jgi:hypothetical protein
MRCSLTPRKTHPNVQLAGSLAQLHGILKLLEGVPDELIPLTSTDYSEVILAKSAIEQYLEHSTARGAGAVGYVEQVNGFDAITVIRRALAKCPDEYPPPATTNLLFITDPDLRESIRQDIGAANGALTNNEWKAATVLAGAAIEALLHWRLQEPSPGAAAAQTTAAALAAGGTIKNPDKNIDRWDLHQFLELAADLKLLKPDTRTAANLAKNFRNLIHPGRAARLAQTCNRGTAYSAIAALEHVIGDLS